MKKIIDDLLYDTSSAEEIADTDNGYNPGDFNYYGESLYRTEQGNWFISRTGGALSCMQVRCGSNNWSGSSDLVEMSSAEVEDWLKHNNKVQALMRFFPDSIKRA